MSGKDRKGKMKHNVFGYICYSLLTACLLYPYDSGAIIHKMANSYERYFEDLTKDDCRNDLGCYYRCNSYNAWSDDFINECASIGNAWWFATNESTAEDWCDNSSSTVYLINSCDTCAQGGGYQVMQMSLGQICNLPYIKNNPDMYGGSTLETLLEMDPCAGESQTNSDFKVCVECVPDINRGSWQSYSTYVVRRQVTTINPCTNSTTTTYEYGCKANTYYVIGTGGNTVCKSCPDNAKCNTNNGHRYTFTCKEGYSINDDGDGCELDGCNMGWYIMPNGYCGECPPGTYQPNNANNGGIGSCLPCPSHSDEDVNGNSVTGNTDGPGNSSVSDCFIGGISYTDSTGTYEFYDGEYNWCYYGS